MAVARKGKNKITVNEKLYLWSVHDAMGFGDEGIWTLEVTADHDWRWQFTYPLTELELRILAKGVDRPPLPDDFDLKTMTLRSAAVTDLGFDRHFRPTPRFVRMLILWYLEHESQLGYAKEEARRVNASKRKQ